MLELVPFDQNSDKELEHVYISKDIILPRIQSEIKRRVEQKQASLKNVRTKSGKSNSGKLRSLHDCPSSFSFSESDAVINDDVVNEVIGEFIIARTLVVPADGVDPLKVRIKQTSSEMADATKLSILMKKPATGKTQPVVSRRRRPSVEAFDILLQSFNSDAECLVRASSSAASFSLQSSQAMEKLEVLKSRPRAMSIDELTDIERQARKVPTPEKLTSKERWLKTIQAIHSHRKDGNLEELLTESSTTVASSSPHRRTRATFPNPLSPTPPTWVPSTLSPAPSRDRSISPGVIKWSGGTRAPPLQRVSPNRDSSTSPNIDAKQKPPRPMWNASPKKRIDEPLGLFSSIGRH